MYCTNCGSFTEAEASYCVHCGFRRRALPTVDERCSTAQDRFGAISADLISELDSGRQGWFSLLRDWVASYGPAFSVVNLEFSENTDVGSLSDDKPDLFTFPTLNGITAEASIIAWQVQSAIGFAVNAEQQYLGEDEARDLLLSVAQSALETKWVFAMKLVVEAFQKGTPIDLESIAVILSHYLMNDNALTPNVLLLYEKLSELMIFLQGITYLGTARTFGDDNTVARLQKTLLG